MKFEYLTRDLWPVANSVASYFKKKKYDVKAEAAVNVGYAFRPTLVCLRKWETVAVEVRPAASIERPFKEFIQQALANRDALTIYVALPREKDGEEVSLPLSFVESSQHFGIGLLLVNDGQVVENQKGAKCSLRFSIPPGRSLGKHKDSVAGAVRKFNRGDCIDGIRDLTELVESSLTELTTKAASRRLLVPTELEVSGLDFEGMINLLGAPAWHGQQQHRMLEEDIKNDLSSFRGARNLGHHPRNKSQQKKLETQLLERAEASIRLLRELMGRIEKCNRLRPIPDALPEASI